MTHAIVLPGPLVLRDPLPAGWVRCPELGCGARAGHEPPHVPEAVPPVAVAPAGRWVRRCTARSDCGAPAGHAPPCVPTRSDCTCSRYDGDTRCNACEGLVWQAAAVAAIAGPEVDVGGELRCSCSAEPAELDCPEHGGAALAWIREHEPATMARLLAALREPAPVTRAERIEAAARAFVAAEDSCAGLRFRGGTAMPDVERILATNRAAVEARDALRAALCSCTAHGPDPACVEHGAALAKWQKENGT